MNHKRIEKRKRRDGAETGAISVFKNSFVGVVFAILMMLALALIFTAIAYTREDPDSLVGFFAVASTCVSSIFAGLISAKRTEKNALASGALSGVIFVLFLWILSLCFNDAHSSDYTNGARLLIRGGVVILSVLGALIGAHKRNTRKRKRRRS